MVYNLLVINTVVCSSLQPNTYLPYRNLLLNFFMGVVISLGMSYLIVPALAFFIPLATLSKSEFNLVLCAIPHETEIRQWLTQNGFTQLHQNFIIDSLEQRLQWYKRANGIYSYRWRD